MTCVWCESENGAQAVRCGSCSASLVADWAGEHTVVSDGWTLHEGTNWAALALARPGLRRFAAVALGVAALVNLATISAAVLTNVLGLGLDDAIAEGRTIFQLKVTYGNLGLLIAMFQLIAACGVVCGALSIFSRRLYRVALIGAIAAIVPMVWPAAIIATPLGITALVILIRPEVAGRFTD